MFRFLLLLCFLFTSISVSRADDTTKPKFDLRIRAQVGDKHRLTVQTDDAMTQVYPDNKTVIRLQTRTEADAEIIEVRASGQVRMKITYRALTVTDNTDGKITRYDSTRDAKSQELLALIMNAVIKSSLVITSDPRGKVVKVEGLKELQNRIIAALKVPASEQGDLREMLAQGFSVGRIADSLGAVVFPETTVGVGDSWQRKFTRNEDLYSVLVNQTLTLQSSESQKITVAVREQISPDPKTKANVDGDASLKYRLSGIGSGALVIDENSGNVTSHSIDQRLAGKIAATVSVSTLEGPTKEPVEFRVYVKKSLRAWSKKSDPQNTAQAELTSRPAPR